MDERGSSILTHTTSRRRFIAGSAITVGAAAVSLGLSQCDPEVLRRVEQAKNPQTPHHRIWVWQFSADAALDGIASALAGKGLGVVVKTHDGTDWMSTYDHSPDAIDGVQRFANVARYFEDRGIPCHAWCVPKGIDPTREAQMAADVLGAGARSLVLDVEGSSGFWLGSTDDALRYGAELRRLSQNGRVDISIDARPWRINLVPMAEFVAFTDGIWPQLYWETFATQGNVDGYNNSGFPVPTAGITPEFLLESTARLLQPYEREIIPVGQGAASDPLSWARFAHRSWDLHMPVISDWRLGVTSLQTLQYLADNPPGPEPKAPPPTPTPTSTPAGVKTGTKTPIPSSTTTTPTRTPTFTRTPAPTAAPSTSTPTSAPTISASSTP